MPGSRSGGCSPSGGLSGWSWPRSSTTSTHPLLNHTTKRHHLNPHVVPSGKQTKRVGAPGCLLLVWVAFRHSNLRRGSCERRQVTPSCREQWSLWLGALTPRSDPFRSRNTDGFFRSPMDAGLQTPLPVEIPTQLPSLRAAGFAATDPLSSCFLVALRAARRAQRAGSRCPGPRPAEALCSQSRKKGYLHIFR